VRDNVKGHLLISVGTFAGTSQNYTKFFVKYFNALDIRFDIHRIRHLSCHKRPIP